MKISLPEINELLGKEIGRSLWSACDKHIQSNEVKRHPDGTFRYIKAMNVKDIIETSAILYEAKKVGCRWPSLWRNNYDDIVKILKGLI